MTQFIVKSLLIIIYLYLSFHFFRVICTKEIDIRYPLNWIKNKVESFLPTTTSEINISPEKVILSTNRWKGVSSFNIYNRISETLYDIYIKLEIEGLGIQSEDIEVTPKNVSDFMAVQLNDVSVNFSILQLKGTDSKSKEFIYLILYNLNPHESQSFRVGLRRISNSNINQSKILIKLIKSSRNPVQILSQDNKASYPINFPEKVTIKSQSILMKRN